MLRMLFDHPMTRWPWIWLSRSLLHPAVGLVTRYHAMDLHCQKYQLNGKKLHYVKAKKTKTTLVITTSSDDNIYGPTGRCSMPPLNHNRV